MPRLASRERGDDRHFILAVRSEHHQAVRLHLLGELGHVLQATEPYPERRPINGLTFPCSLLKLATLPTR